MNARTAFIESMPNRSTDALLDMLQQYTRQATPDNTVVDMETTNEMIEIVRAEIKRRASGPS